MEQEKLLKIATDGAKKYNAHQMELLKKFAGIDCGTGNLEGNKKVVDIVTEELKALGAEWEYVTYPNVGTHVIGRIRPANPTGKIIVNAHLDTVFHEGDVQKYPFHVEGDWAWGLGIADCKGGFVTSVCALRIMHEAGLLPNKEITMIYSCDEETGSHTGREVFERESKDAQYAFVFEPARNKNGIITRRKGQAFVHVSVKGIEAHAALNYKNGASATLELARKIEQMQQMENEEAGIHYNVGRMSGASTSLVVAGEAWCEASVSLENAQSIHQVEADCKALEASVTIPGCSVQTDVDVLFPTQDRTDRNVELYELVKQAGSIMGLELPEESSSGPSDACYFSTFGVATVDAMGPFMQDIHTTNERMYIPALEERTKLFCLVLGVI